MSPRESHTWFWGLWLLPSLSILPSFLLQMGQPVACKFYLTETVIPTVYFFLSTVHCFLSSSPQMILPSFLFFSARIGCSSRPFSCPQTCLRKWRNRIWVVTSSALKLQRNISFSHELPNISMHSDRYTYWSVVVPALWNAGLVAKC